MKNRIAGVYQPIKATPNKVCSITGLNAGQSYLTRWTNAPIPGVTPGSDANDMTQTFANYDQYGLPDIAIGVTAPTFQGYISGLQCPNTAGFQAATATAWVAMPVGVNSVRFSYRGYGNTSGGLYVGKAFKYAKRVYWNNVGLGTADIDLSQYSLLCGRRILAMKTFCCNGYFNGGHWVTVSYDGGATYVDIPTANTFGQQPFQSQWP